mgnify:CR=1 FL=1
MLNFMQDILNVNSKAKVNQDRTNNLQQGQSFNMMQSQILGIHKKVIEGLQAGSTNDQRDPEQKSVLAKVNKDEQDVMDFKKSVYDRNLDYTNSTLNTYINELNVLKVEGDYDDISSYQESMNRKYDRLAGLRNEADFSAQYLEGSARDLGNDIKRKNDQKKDLNVNLQNTTGELSKQFGNLKGEREKLRVLQTKDNALDGELDNVELTGNSIHLRYMAWMISAVTMLGIAAHQMSK